ncbi:hypothetical protein ACIGQE_21825 [Streptomyces sp. NPDC053429]|uniref:hypothetical protein n=1 Tax=Streptomyces sp. NPDC053429 TaxID=3365702 RepID=UPI0037CE2016
MSKKRIILIHNEETTRNWLQENLEKKGYEVTGLPDKEAQVRHEVVELMYEKLYDAIVVDESSESEPVDVLDEVRKHFPEANTGFVYMTPKPQPAPSYEQRLADQYKGIEYPPTPERVERYRNAGYEIYEDDTPVEEFLRVVEKVVTGKAEAPEA